MTRGTPRSANLLLFFSSVSLVSSRSITVANFCSYPVWPAYVGSATGSTQPSGWEAQSCSSVTFDVADDFSGRFWGRTACDSNGTHCATADCGALVCTGNGATPASLAEFTLSGGANDFYDVSLVDGANVPIAIMASNGCPESSCPADLVAQGCSDPSLQVKDSSGTVVACNSACGAAPAATKPQTCCTDNYNTPQTCPSSQIPFYSQVKASCPDAYAYAYDDATSTFTCPTNLAASYAIVFCPSSSSTCTSVKLPDGIVPTNRKSDTPSDVSNSVSHVGTSTSTVSSPTKSAKSMSGSVAILPAMSTSGGPRPAQNPFLYFRSNLAGTKARASVSSILILLQRLLWYLV